MGTISVLIVGVTGRAGGSVANALLGNPAFKVVAATRPSSLSKPEIASLKARGAEIRSLDLSTFTAPDAPLNELVELLKGIDVVISGMEFLHIKQQYPLVDAAKQAGVKRFIPSDWSPCCVRGLRKLHDEKLDLHEYIIKKGILYTFIDTGQWFWLPAHDSSKAVIPQLHEYYKQMHGSGDVKSAFFHPRDIGPYVLRILLDKPEHTIGKYIFLYGEHLSERELFEIASRASGTKFEPEHLSEEEVLKRLEQCKKDEAKEGLEGMMAQTWRAVWEYTISLWFRGDCTIENAKKPEYGCALDGRELYPDVKTASLEEYAKELYA